MQDSYNALVVRQSVPGDFSMAVEKRSIADLPAGELLVRVKYSSLNFKDMLSVNGHPAVTQTFPHQPGIDAAGIVEMSESGLFQAGDEVIVTGYDLGMNTPGGLGQYIRVPAEWVVKRPERLTLRQSMVYGTAGFTANLCIQKLMQVEAKPEDGKVAVTGASGGVGTMAIAQLAKLNFKPVAVSGRTDNPIFKILGAVEVIQRDELLRDNSDTLGMFVPALFAHGIDCVGGDYLAGLLNAVEYSGSVACCGLASSMEFSTSVLPFITRNVNLLGVDCVELTLQKKAETWERCVDAIEPEILDKMAKEISLQQVPEYLSRIGSGSSEGRYLVNLDA